MVCPVCGRELSATAVVCNGCGASCVEPSSDRPLRTKALIAILAAAAVLVASAFAATALLFRAPQTPAAFVCLAGDRYVLFPDADENADTFEIAPTDSERLGYNAVSFDKDGTYVYFYQHQRYDSSIYEYVGTLCRIPVEALGATSADNAPYIETIAENVRTHAFVGTHVAYITHSGTLILFDGTSHVTVGESIRQLIKCDDSHLLYTTTENVLYGVRTAQPDKPLCLSENATGVRANGADDILFFEKNADPTKGNDLYRIGFDSEKTRLGEGAYILAESDGTVYFTKLHGEALNLYDVLNDGTTLSDADLLAQLKDNRNSIPLFAICRYEQQRVTVLHEGVLHLENPSLSFTDTNRVRIFNTADMLTDLPSLSEIRSLRDAKALFEIDPQGQNYILDLRSSNICRLSADALVSLADTDNHYYPLGDALFVNSDNGILRATVKNGVIGAFAPIADNAFIRGADGDTLYYTADARKENGVDCADLCAFRDGTAVFLKTVQQAHTLSVYDDGMLMITEKNDNNRLTVIDSNGNTAIEAVGVTRVVRAENGDLLYISDNRLFAFDGKSTVLLKEGVGYIWVMKETKVNTVA